MSSRKKIEERIRKKEAEIQVFEVKIREARAYIQALQDVMKLLPRDEGVSAKSILRPGSASAEAREMIMKRGVPMHISDIVTGMGREDNRKNRAAIAGSVSAYVRRGEIFTRPSPNTFGLVEFQEDEIAEDKPTPETEEELPSNFGTDEGDKIIF
jgi:hypothetical protein